MNGSSQCEEAEKRREKKSCWTMRFQIVRETSRGIQARKERRMTKKEKRTNESITNKRNKNE